MTQAVCVLVILLFNVYLLPLFFLLFTHVHLLIDGSSRVSMLQKVGALSVNILTGGPRSQKTALSCLITDTAFCRASERHTVKRVGPQSVDRKWLPSKWVSFKPSRHQLLLTLSLLFFDWTGAGPTVQHSSQPRMADLTIALQNRGTYSLDKVSRTPHARMSPLVMYGANLFVG